MANMESRRATMKSALAENLRALMTRKMYEKITIKQICDETGVIRATFYNYFDDKYDCLNWIIHIDFFTCESLLESAGIREYAAALLHILEEEREFYRAGYGVVGQNSFQEITLSHTVLRSCLPHNWRSMKKMAGIIPHETITLRGTTISTDSIIFFKEFFDFFCFF